MEVSPSQFYYSDWLMIAVTIVAFIVSMRQRNKVKGLRLISYYIIMALITDLLSIYIQFLQSSIANPNKMQSAPEALFCFFEIILLTNFLYHNIKGITKRRIMLGVFLFFCISLTYCCANWHRHILNLPVQFFGIEALCLVIPSLFYFHEFFTSPTNPILKNHPQFWVAFGILLCNGGAIPIYILIALIHNNLTYYFRIFFTINYILYSILFLLIVKAYLCVPKATV